VPNLYNEPSLQNISTMTGGMFEHAPQVNFVEGAIPHAFQKMRA
jgi:hypothetical protein